MDVSDVLEIRVKKSHVAILSVVVLVASASAAVNVRDPMNVFGDIDMQGNKVVNASEYRFTPSYLREYAKTHGNDNTIQPKDMLDAIADYRNGEITENQVATVILYFKNGREVSSGLRAAPMTDNGKLAATGVKLQGTTQGEGIQPPNFTLSTDINMQGNNIYNAANLNGKTGGGGNGGSTGIGEVDIIEEDGTLGPYKYCSIAKLEYPDDIRGGCTVSRNSEGVWEKTTDANNVYECHAACFGLPTETATVTVDASPSSGNVQTIPLDQEYQNIIKAEWMGGGIQPEITPDGPNSREASWRISLHNSETNQRYEIARTGGREVPGGTQAARPPYFAEGDFTGTSLNPVTDTTAVGVSYRQDSYTARFPQVTADGVKLNAGGYNEFIFNDKDPETIYWSGSEEVKITYVPQN